jgi:hypothetical protein
MQTHDLIPRPCRSSSGYSLASHRGWPASLRSSMWGLWWTKRHWGRFSPSTSVSSANHHSINFFIIIITQGWHNRPVGGRSAEWTQLDATPYYTNLTQNSCNVSSAHIYIYMTIANLIKIRSSVNSNFLLH